MLSRFPVTLLALLATIAVPSAVRAQGWIEPVQPAQDGRIEKLRSAVQVTVNGRVARVTVEEWFRNGGAVMGEGTYLYSLPGEAVFNDFSLWQGDRELKGEMMDAVQARAIYESIVRRKRDPALIELAGHGLLRARVFPINPGETRKITLRYTQLLDRVGDAWRFRLAKDPTSVPRSVHVEVDSAGSMRDPYSPTHRLTASRQGDRLVITLADSSAGTDLELLLPLARGLVGMSIVTQHPAGEADGYFMALLAPGQTSERAVRRDLVAVLDISGSMSGEKLEQGKAALLQLLGTLHSGDRFRMIAFASAVRPEAPGWSEASRDNVARAEQWVRGLVAEGGTNIAGALTEAFGTPADEGALGVVVFLTDGLPTVGETDPERIADAAERARGTLRVFSFGLGYDVNTFLLDRLAERARGTSEYVAPGADIERAVGSLAAKLASPVLTDLTLSGNGAELYDLEPTRLPDLFAGEELVVFGRYRNAGRGGWSATVSGRRGGRAERFATEVPGGDVASHEYITQLWAARRAGALTREVRLHGQTAELMNSLKELALRYGVLTEYTSYLVQEPNMVAVRPFEDRPVPVAPAKQFGAPSVAQARREAQSAGAMVASDGSELDRATRGRLGTAQTKRVGSRLFVWRESTWTDLGHDSSRTVVTVAPFSDAYFALLAALPELAQPAALEPAVLIAGRRISVKLAAGGRTDLDPEELSRIVGEFR